MVRAPWTYELPPTGSFAENLDDYEARAPPRSVAVRGAVAFAATVVFQAAVALA